MVLTYGAIESTNVERWALEFGAAVPPILPGTMRRSAYETDVVGSIYRLGQRYWGRRGEAAVWERPFPTGDQGRPPAIDISLFNATEGRETRIEFGMYSTTAKGTLTTKKLVDDSAKLLELATRTEDDYPNVENFAVLWHTFRSSMTNRRRRDLRQTLNDHARSVSSDVLSVELLVTSGGHLFASDQGQHHWVAIGAVRPDPWVTRRRVGRGGVGSGRLGRGGRGR